MNKEQLAANYVYGKNPVKEKLKSVKSGTLFLQKTREKNKYSDLAKKAESKNLNVTFLDKMMMNKNFGDYNHQGIVLKIEEEYSFILDEKEFLDKINLDDNSECCITILDGVKDVGNYGAVLRSCLLFDVKYVVLPKDNSAPVNEFVIKRSAGSVFQLKIVYVTNLNRIIEKLKKNGFWVYAADKDGDRLDKTAFDESKTAIVFGDEGKGIRRLTLEKCDYRITIPTNKKLDSLNISVSAGIILHDRYSKKNTSLSAGQ